MVPKFLNSLVRILVFFLVIVSCDPCDDCEAVVFEPTVSLVFINQDSIKNLDDSLMVFAFNDSALASNIDSLTILRDSLETVNDSIANGGSLSNEKMNLEQWIIGRQADSTSYATLNQDADSLTALFNATKSTINSGLILVDQIELLGANSTLTYEDSATIWSIPLSYDGAFTQYEITIGSFSDIIELEYDNIQEVDEQRNVLIRAENIRLISFTKNAIDSVLTDCEENCKDDEATFTIYF